MSKKLIQYIVIILGIFIFMAFLTLIYGIYLKISISSKNSINTPYIFSLELNNNEKIKNIEVINENKILVLIQGTNNIKGAIYDIKNKKIIGFVQR